MLRVAPNAARQREAALAAAVLRVAAVLGGG